MNYAFFFLLLDGHGKNVIVWVILCYEVGYSFLNFIIKEKKTTPQIVHHNLKRCSFISQIPKYISASIGFVNIGAYY